MDLENKLKDIEPINPELVAYVRVLALIDPIGAEVFLKKNIEQIVLSKIDVHNKAPSLLAKRIMFTSLIVSFILICVIVLFVMFSNQLGLTEASIALVSTTTGMLIQSLLSERNTIVNYYFGSSDQADPLK